MTYKRTIYTFVGRGRPVDGRIAAVVEISGGGVTRLVDPGIRLGARWCCNQLVEL